ncbi:PoNe immunity protein domain-containing protein [Acinetobacter baumannii]|uniref:PoNe immunity protein domain-containing protein n=1 Tax=Acinetobacter baumannii TaxID=470 RepID=UPI0038B456A9
MITLLNEKDWKNLRREPYQKFSDYQKRLDFNLKNIQIGLNNLENDSDHGPDDYYVGLMNASNAIAQLSLKSVFFSYSAGLTVEELADFFPKVVEYWQLYAKHHINFHQSSESDGHLVPHLELVTDEYWEALQLVCFSILFAQPEHLKTIMEILAYENDEQDALLDKLVSPWLPDREISEVYLRQLPYRKLEKVFTADEADRPALMSAYMDEWYGASKREPYHDRHKSSQFPGYWSLEAAAITVILRIDDSSYRDKPYYPKDLVDYARSQYMVLDEHGNIEGEANRLRCEAGQSCPQSGEWYSPANNMQKRYFNQGEIMPEIKDNSWGETIWYLDLEN